MQPEGQSLPLEASVEELDLPDHLIRDLRNEGILNLRELLGQTEESLARVNKSSFHTWGKKSIEKVQVALVKAGHKRLPRIIPRNQEPSS